MQWAGVDLDRTLDDQPVAWSPGILPNEGKYPMLRISGVRMNVRVLLYNWGLTMGAGLRSSRICIIQVSSSRLRVDAMQC